MNGRLDEFEIDVQVEYDELNSKDYSGMSYVVERTYLLLFQNLEENSQKNAIKSDNYP